MLLILFGLPAGGKNFVGRILQAHFDFMFHDGDDDLPPAMRLAIQQQQIATDAMRDHHLANMLTSIQRLQAHHTRVALAGAFFKERNRRQVLAVYPHAQFILVETTPALRRERLSRRQNHLANVAYAEKIMSQFEPPQHPYVLLMNDADEGRVEQQIRQILKRGTDLTPDPSPLWRGE